MLNKKIGLFLAGGIGAAVVLCGALALGIVPAHAQDATVNGVCGTSARYTCVSGTAVNEYAQYEPGGDNYLWTCVGQNGGTDSPSCIIYPPASSNSTTGTSGTATTQTVTTAPGVTLSILGASGGTFAVGQAWTLSVGSNIPNSSVTLCAIDNHNVQSCTPNEGTTDSAGSWSLGGSFPSSTVGNWQEWAEVDGVSSNNVVFSVVGAGGGAVPIIAGENPQSYSPTLGYCSYNSNCNTFQGQVCFDAATPQSYCGLPQGSAGSSVSAILSTLPAADQAGCSGNFQQDLPSLQQCEAIFTAQATALGYQTSCTNTLQPFPVQGPNGSLDTYTATCSISGNGVLGKLNASVAPWTMVGSSNASSPEGTTSNQWATLEQPAVSGSTSPTTSGSATTGASTISSVNSNLNNSLGQISLGNPNAPATTTTTTTTTTGGSCANTAQATITSSLASLQSVAGMLATENVSPAVLTGIQSLVAAIANVLAALTQCVTPTPPPGTLPVTTSQTPISCTAIENSPVNNQTEVTFVGSGGQVVGSSGTTVPQYAWSVTGAVPPTGNGTNFSTYFTTPGTYTATVTDINPADSDVSATCNVTIPAAGGAAATSSAPVIQGLQGYNPSNGSYTNGTVLPNTYLILYGNFSASGNTATINGSPATITYQSVNQINIQVGNIPTGIGKTVAITSSAGLTASSLFIVQDAIASSNATMPSSFPVMVTVTVTSLNVRSSPASSAPLAGSQTLSEGDTFIATNEVVGQSVAGNNLWWVSSAGNYVWSGGTTYAAVPATTAAGSAPILNVVAAGASNVSGATITVNYGNQNYSADPSGSSEFNLPVGNSFSVAVKIASANYNAALSGNCDGTAAAGQVYTCTVTYSSSGSGSGGAGIVDYCTSNPTDPSCSAWLFCLAFPNAVGCPVNTQTGSSTPAPSQQVTETAETTLAAICAKEPSSPDCKNLSTCTSNPQSTACAVATSTAATACSAAQTQESECSSEANNSCQVVDGDPTCVCNTGFIANAGDPNSGCIALSSVDENCSIESNGTVTCIAGGTCTLNLAGEASCSCNDGYVKSQVDLQSCVPLDSEDSDSKQESETLVVNITAPENVGQVSVTVGNTKDDDVFSGESWSIDENEQYDVAAVPVDGYKLDMSGACDGLGDGSNITNSCAVIYTEDNSSGSGGFQCPGGGYGYGEYMCEDGTCVSSAADCNDLE